MALNYNTVKTSLYTWADSIVNPIPVILYQPNAPRPSLPYVTLYLNSIVSIGDDYLPRPDSAGDITLVGDRDFTVQVQAYGDNALTILENLRTSLQKPSVLDTLRANGIVFVNSLAINDITALLDTEWEPRGSMDVLFRIAQTDSDNLGVIETVELEEIFSNGQSVVYDETITITAP